MAMRAIDTASAITVSVIACELDRPKIDPNSTLTPDVASVPLDEVVYTVRKRAPRPSIQAKTFPITVSSARPRAPRAAIPSATTTQATYRPRSRSTPATSAASAPVNATWLKASPVNTCPRRTTK